MESHLQISEPIPSMQAANENNNNYLFDGMRNNNQSNNESQLAPPLFGEESIARNSSLADEIYNFFSSGDNNNKNAAGTNALFGEGLQGFDPLIAIKDCCCKTPLLDALKKQTEATTREKEAHEVTRSKCIISQREVNNLRIQINVYIDNESHLKMENNDLRATVEQLQTRVQDAKEAAGNTETLIERIRSELVVKHGELAREVQRANKAQADVELLEQQVETLQRQVSEYDEERIVMERGRTALQSKFVEGVAKFKTLKVEAEMEKDELAQFISVMQEQVKIMSVQKTTAEQESRAYREKLEAMTTNSGKDKQQIRTLEEALTKEEADHNAQVVSLKSEIGRLEELVDSIRSKALTEVSGLDRSRGQCNNLLLRATKEIAHLDQTTEDLKSHVDALNQECQSLKDAKKEADDEFKFKEEVWNDEKKKLMYEINRLGVIGSEMDEARNEAEVKILNLEEELSNSERLLQINENEMEQLEEAMEKRTESLNNALKGATESLHEEMEGLKATLRAKSRELQELKSAVNAAGGEVSLMPLDRDDFQRALRESEELKKENAELAESLRHSSIREEQLQSELNGIFGGDEEGGGEEEEEVRPQREAEPKEDRENGLKTELTELQEKFDELQKALAIAEGEAKKLTNILKETLEVKPIDINAELYQTRMPKNDHENRVEKNEGEEDDPMASAPISGGRGASSPSNSSRNSLEALAHQVKMARNYQLRKNVGETMQRHGVDNSELAGLVKTYEGEHMDFNKILDDVLHKAQKYRAERVALTNQIKEFKVESHFLKLELTMYKELEVKIKEMGNLDDEAVKNAKVDVAEKMAKAQPPADLDPELLAAIGKSDYPRSTIVKMTTMFAEQKHILDVAHEFRSLDDLLRALREDIVSETMALKKEIKSIIRLVDSMKEDGGAKNENAGGGGGGGGGEMNGDDGESGNVAEAINENEAVELAASSRFSETTSGRDSGMNENENRAGGSVKERASSSGAGKSAEVSRQSAGRESARRSGRASPTKALTISSSFREPLVERVSRTSGGGIEDANQKREFSDVKDEEGDSLRSSPLELTEDEEGGEDTVVEEEEFLGTNGNAEKSSRSHSHRSPRVDFVLPPDSNKNNLSEFSGCVGAPNWKTGGEYLGSMKTKQILKEASLEEVEREGIAADGGYSSSKRRRDEGKSKKTIRRRMDYVADGEDTASESERSGRFASPSVMDEQGNKWVTDDAGRRWVVDGNGWKWRLGLDEQHYMIDETGVKWTVEEVEGRRRRWRRNRRGEYVFAEEDGVEWVVDDRGNGGRGGAEFARRRDEGGNWVLRDENRLEWILDEVGRGWRENEKGQTMLLDEVGRTWKFEMEGKGTGKYGHRRDALGQRWMIDLHGAVWLVTDDRRGWRVDSDTNVLAVETGRGAEARWLIERSSGIQWLVDEKRQRLRAASKREAFAVPLEVKLALNVDVEMDSVSIGGRSAGSRRGGRDEEERSVASGGRRRRGERSGSEAWTEESGMESAGPKYSEEPKRRRGKRSREETEDETDEMSGPSRTPSLLRAKAEKLRRKAADRQAALSSAKNANNVVSPPPEKPDRPSYFDSTWGM